MTQLMISQGISVNSGNDNVIIINIDILSSSTSSAVSPKFLIFLYDVM